MMNLKQLKDNEDLSRRQLDSGSRDNYKLITAYIKYFSVPAKSAAVKTYLPSDGKEFSGLQANQKVSAVSNASGEVRSLEDLLKNRNERNKDLIKTIRSSMGRVPGKVYAFGLPASRYS